MISNYVDLLQSVADYLDRDDLHDQVADFVWMAECELQADIRFRDVQDKTEAGTTIEGEEWVNLPDDYQEGLFFRWQTDDTLPTFKIASIAEVDAIQRLEGATQPRLGFVWGKRLYIGPVPGEVGYELFYRAGVRHLGDGVQTNRILREYPTAILYGALRQSAPYLAADERLATWESLYQPAKDAAMRAEWRGRHPGPLVMRPDVQVY